jgi:hypothetical protein
MTTIEMKGDQVIIAEGQWVASLFCSRQPAFYPYPLTGGGLLSMHIAPSRRHRIRYA